MKFGLNESNNNVGFENDEIFLLSTDEYEKYKKVIPYYDDFWWLRTPVDDYYYAASVHFDDIDCIGELVDDDNDCVRPALRVSDIESSNLRIGDEFEKYDNIWVKIDTNLAISKEGIIELNFDSKYNDYKNSDIRWWLKKWLYNKKN